MNRATEETRKDVVRKHIAEGRTLSSLAAEYGVSKATISNWVRLYREECQTNDEEKTLLEFMEELRKIRQEYVELVKKNRYLKNRGILCEEKHVKYFKIN